MVDTVVITHPELPGREYATTRAQFESVWKGCGWQLKPDAATPAAKSSPVKAGTAAPAEPVTNKES
jgi:hypothetical protein